MQLVNRTVLITGAASGLGAAMALRIAARGGRIVAWDLDQAGLESLMANLPGSGHQWAVVDVADRARSTTPPPDRPGGCPRQQRRLVSGRRILEVSDEQIEKTMGVNALALFWTTRAFLPGMIDARPAARS